MFKTHCRTDKSVDAVIALVAKPHLPGVGDTVTGFRFARDGRRASVSRAGNEVTPLPSSDREPEFPVTRFNQLYGQDVGDRGGWHADG